MGLECQWAIEAPTSLFSAQLHSYRSLSQDSQALLLSQVTSYLLNLSEVSQYYYTSKVVSGLLESLSAAPVWSLLCLDQQEESLGEKREQVRELC